MDIAKIIERLGGPAVVGRLCGITSQAVSQWPRVPTRFIFVIADQTDLTPHDLRRDLYPHPLDGRRKRRRATS